MSVMSDVRHISCTLVYCCVSQILTYQLIISVVTDMSTSAVSAYQCAYQLCISVLLCQLDIDVSADMSVTADMSISVTQSVS